MKRYQHSHYEINVIRCIMELIFIKYNFCMVDVDIFFYKVSQTLQSLTLTNSYMQTKKKQREYIASIATYSKHDEYKAMTVDNNFLT